jgi:ubiquinone/menaquinone biosynthesis C-methylase UbiE
VGAVNPEDLPFGASHFDRVLSAVGGSLAMAPNQRRVAAELVRVCRPGGVLAVANWTAEGLVGHVARVIASYRVTGDTTRSYRKRARKCRSH